MGMRQPPDSLTLPFDKCYYFPVIDVYQAWCGPCKAVQSLFRKLKNELNEDEILHFVVVRFLVLFNVFAVFKDLLVLQVFY
jgi:thiol-disulfide isomerase/thioredoxin